jgi:hypothetical protein
LKYDVDIAIADLESLPSIKGLPFLEKKGGRVLTEELFNYC